MRNKGSIRREERRQEGEELYRRIDADSHMMGGGTFTWTGCPCTVSVFGYSTVRYGTYYIEISLISVTYPLSFHSYEDDNILVWLLRPQLVDQSVSNVINRMSLSIVISN